MRTIVLCSALCLLSGCVDTTQLRTDMALLEQKIGFVEEGTNATIEDLRAMEAQGNQRAGEYADKLEKIKSDFEADVGPVIAEVNRKIEQADDGEELAIGAVEIVGGLLGVGGLTGVITDRWRKNKEARDRADVARILTQGETAADKRTIALLPPDFAEAIRTNGKEHG